MQHGLHKPPIADSIYQDFQTRDEWLAGVKIHKITNIRNATWKSIHQSQGRLIELLM